MVFRQPHGVVAAAIHYADAVEGTGIYCLQR